MKVGSMVCAVSALSLLCFELHAHLVVVVKVDPSSQTPNDLPPLLRVGHNDLATSAVVLCNTDLLNGLTTAHAELFLKLVIDDLLDGYT
jgi:hypothetical protein